MIEKIIIDYLNECLAVPVSGQVPAELPASFVTVEKVGVGVRNYIYAASISVKSWAATQADASALNEAVKTAMSDITQLDEVSRCHLETDYNNPDTTRKMNRYEASFSVVHY